MTTPPPDAAADDPPGPPPAQNLNDDDLKDIVSAISPDLSALLDEDALDSLLMNTSRIDDDDDSPTKRRQKSKSTKDDGGGDSDDDSADHEFHRLAAAEDSLREELDMVGGLGMLMASPLRGGSAGGIDPTGTGERIVEREKIVYLAGAGSDGGGGGEGSGVGEARNKGSLLSGDEEDEGVAQVQAQAQAEAPMASPAKTTRGPMQYTYTDHAVHRSVQSLPSDMGCISVPLLGREEVEDMFPPLSSSGGADGTMEIGNLNPFDPNTAAAIANLGNEMEGEAKEEGGVDQEEHVTGLAGAYDDLMSSAASHSSQPNNSTGSLHQSKNDDDELEKGQQQEEQEREEFLSTTQNCFREYVRPVAPGMLRKMFAGLVEPIDSESRTMTYIKEVGGETAPGATAANRPERDDAPLGSGGGGGGGGASTIVNAGENNSSRSAVEPVPPVRTVTIRIRPDVLCGAVMDAISTAVTDVGGEITKRRGGHLRCTVPGYWLGRGKSASRQTSANELDGMGLGSLDGAATTPIQAATPGALTPGLESEEAHLTSSFSHLLSPFSSHSKAHKYGNQQKAKDRILLPPITVDVQLVTRKLTRECERILLIRVYKGQDDEAGGNEAFSQQLDFVSVDVDSMGLDLSHHGGMTECPIDEWGGILLREAGSLVQKMDEHEDYSFGEILNGGRSVRRGRDVQISAEVVRETVGVSLPPTPNDIDDSYIPSATRNTPHAEGSTSKYIKAFGSMITSPFRSPVPGSISRVAAAGSSAPSRAAGMFADQSAATAAASNLLRRTFHQTISVEKNKKTIPCLCLGDYLSIQSSWRFLREVLSELDSRTLSYPTLSTYPFGTFPSLPTVDVHYCSQLRLVSRENMILSLLQMASELEVYAREAEYSCANLIQILRVTYADYGMNEPALPTPLPLSAYPLDFEPHESQCPPWGQLVMEALNKIQKSSSDPAGTETTPIDPNDVSLRKAPGVSRSAAGYRAARDAVALVSSAFSRQADDEQAARLGRKNTQVVDRLAKMQAHKRLSVLTLRSAYGKNPAATKAGDELNRRIEKYGPKSFDDEGEEEVGDQALLSFFTPMDRVPLLRCGIAIGAATTGICYVTANEFVCITQVIPVLGSKRFWSIPIVDVDVVVNEVASTLMNPLGSDTITVHDLRTPEADGFTFTPALVANRFKAFVEVIRDVATEDPETLKLSERGGLMYSSSDIAHKEVTFDSDSPALMS